MKKMNTFFMSAIASLLFSTMSTGNDVIQWSFQTGGRVIATPVIRNDSLFIGSLDGNFYLLNALTGTEFWHFETGNEIRTTAVLYEDIICFESGNVMYGLDPGGDLLWTDTLYKGDLLNEHDMWDVFRSSPALSDSLAFIGSEEGLIIGVNVKTGERIFEAQTPQADVTIETTPAIYNNKVYVGDWMGVFSVFDITTQDLVWQYDTKEDNTYSWVNSLVSQPLIYHDTVYFGGRNCNLYAFDPETGDRFWMYHQPDNMWLFGGPVVYEDTFYVGSSFQQVVYAFNPHQPELFWETGVYGINYGYPVIHDNYILTGTGNTGGISSGSLTIIDRKSRTMIERLNVPGWVETPLYLNGTIYFGCANGKVYAISEEALLNTQRPHTFVKEEDPIDLGQLDRDEPFSCSLFYLYNDGEAEDSITCNSQYSYASIEPQAAILAPGDSLEVSVSFDLSDQNPGNRSMTLRFLSHKSLVPALELSRKVIFEITGVEAGAVFEQPSYYSVGDIFPNPACGSASVKYDLEKNCQVQIRLFSSSGKELSCLVDEIKPAGSYTLKVDTSFLFTFNMDEHFVTRSMSIIN